MEQIPKAIFYIGIYMACLQGCLINICIIQAVMNCKIYEALLLACIAAFSFAGAVFIGFNNL
jgi:hypothetical protein